jgi:3-oxoacyl-[acyl-carrier-protein] synthase-3
MEKTHTIMDKWGYTGSACMPMALDDALEQGESPEPGDLVIFCSSGAGFTMSAAAFLWV